MTVSSLGTAACAVAVALCVPASAATITIGQQNTNNIFADSAGQNIWASGGSVIFEGTPEDVTGGLFRLTGDDGVNPPYDFEAFCFEFAQFFTPDLPFDMSAIADAGVLARVDALYTNAFASITDAITAAAFQFALWEISVDTVLDLDAGDFQLTSSDDAAMKPLAAGYLSNIQSGTWVGEGRNVYTLWSHPTAQDVLTVSQVPLPTSIVLLMGALAGFAFVGRKSG